MAESCGCTPIGPFPAPCGNRAVGKSQISGYNLQMQLLNRITHDPTVMGGRPCIRGMRVTVGTIMGLLASGRTQQEILSAYPYLEAEDVQAALAYAAWRTQEVELPLT
ncbi:MAG TPA: DUF433 domain-containing protein [Polyangiaceae bacterium]|jgi:uncharacterized protein (DUF433 family)|nr:DUF433 domain-containing protein [Polyangiaceae bacterium]